MMIHEEIFPQHANVRYSNLLFTTMIANERLRLLSKYSSVEVHVHKEVIEEGRKCESNTSLNKRKETTQVNLKSSLRLVSEEELAHG